MLRRSRSRDQDPGETLTLPSGPRCLRCNGDRDGNNVMGGWLPHFRHVSGLWYTFSRCCPDCAFGAYRQRCTGQAFYGQFSAGIHELGMFQQCLKPGMTLSQAAWKMTERCRDAFVTEAQTIEGTERGGWQQYNQPALPVAAGDVGF